MCAMAEIWVARHGETEWSAAGRHTSRTDLPLTPAGEKQALELSARRGRPWALVLSSPLSRARRTAELCGFAPVIDDDLAEWDYGAAEGLTTTELSARGRWSVWDDPLGESLEDLATRVRRVLARLPEGDSLLFAHGHVLRVLAAVYLGLEPVDGKHLVLQTARVGVLGREHDNPAVLAWNL
jgi:probable phosphoglycerate mutase